MGRPRSKPPRSPELAALGHAIVLVLAEAQTTVETVALDSGLNLKLVGGYARGQGNPTVVSLLKLCKGLHINPSELLWRMEELLDRGAYDLPVARSRRPGEHMCATTPREHGRIAAALSTEHLSWLLAHRDALGLADDAEVCRMICQQRPDEHEQLNQAIIEWIRRYATEARKQQREDYILIVQAFDALRAHPERSVGQLHALCAARGL